MNTQWFILEPSEVSVLKSNYIRVHLHRFYFAWQHQIRSFLSAGYMSRVVRKKATSRKTQKRAGNLCPHFPQAR